MPGFDIRTANTADDSTVRRLKALSGATASYLFRILECEEVRAFPARACLHGVKTVTIGRRGTRGGELHDGTLSVFGPDRFLSSTHSRMRRTADGWLLEDAGSKNGTLLGGVPVDRHLLVDGDLFEAGHTFFLFRALLPPRPESARAWVEASEMHLETGLLTLQPQLEATFEQLRAVSPSKLPLLITGETGTGKELAASAAHALSGRPGPLQAVNCAAIEPAMLESLLFGHKRGAFPGAVDDAEGLLRASDGGTLFLDEIGELPVPAQATLLRALQQSEVTPVGASQAVKIDLRLIAATHLDLAALAAAGAFRGDLLARLQGFVLRLPPLRERREDLGLLIAQLLRRQAEKSQDISMLPESARALLSHRWPLNMRELDQALAAALLLAKGGPIALEHLPAAIRSPATFKSAAAVAREPPSAPPSTPGETSLFDELKRRRVFRSLVAYGLVAFGVLQIIEPIMHGLHWPDEILTYVVLALAAGFLLTALLSWAYDLRAGRILRAPPTSGLRSGRLAALLLAVGVLAAAPGLAWYFLVRGGAVPAIAAADLSIAVLRFAESTPGYEQDRFAGGVAQKIAVALAHIDGLQVSGPIPPSGRGDSIDPLDARRMIAAHVVRGTVQRDNGKLRVIVEIVRLADDRLLWSKTFEGEPAGQLALQDDIARAVVAALRARLPPKPG